MATKNHQARLSPTFTSLYRLFLRTTSASVLHHTAAKRNLRRLWRPTFDNAVQVTKRLENGPKDVTARKELEIWLEVWNNRSQDPFH